jgi:hypothetical protein
MAELTQHEWRLLDEAQASRTQQLRESLEKLGVQFRIAHFTGDSSYPTEYTLTYGPVQAVGPTFDLAVAEFIEKLLKHVPVEQHALELEAEPPSHDDIHTVEAYRREFEAKQAQQEYEDTQHYIEHHYLGGE